MDSVHGHAHNAHLIFDLRLGIFALAFLCQLFRERFFFWMQLSVEPVNVVSRERSRFTAHSGARARRKRVRHEIDATTSIFQGSIKIHCDLKRFANAEKTRLTPAEMARLIFGSIYDTHKINATHKNAVDLSQYKNFSFLDSTFLAPNISHVTNIEPRVIKTTPIPKFIIS
ncbi:hypothetical protein [Burkholderia sp. PR2]|uniref:hypothetical protein n=1 Tax=Burkholderia sp. PR2 TaxID=3448078 RepID=UPI00402AAF7F